MIVAFIQRDKLADNIRRLGKEIDHLKDQHALLFKQNHQTSLALSLKGISAVATRQSASENTVSLSRYP